MILKSDNRTNKSELVEYNSSTTMFATWRVLFVRLRTNVPAVKMKEFLTETEVVNDIVECDQFGQVRGWQR